MGFMMKKFMKIIIHYLIIDDNITTFADSINVISTR